MKNTRGYDVRRVVGLPEDDDRVDVKIGDIGDVASEDTLGSILQKLVDVITENDEIRAKIVGDVTIESVEVDRVQLIDADGNTLVFTEGGEINFIATDGKIATLGTTTDEATAETVIGLLKALKAKDYATETTLDTLKTFLEVLGTTDDADTLATMVGLLKNLKGKDFATETTLEAARALLEAIKGTDGVKKIVDKVDIKVADGDNVALGSTSDTSANTTVIGRLEKLIADLSALSATKTLADLETAIEGVTDSIESMQYGGLPVSEMRTDVVSTSTTPAEAKGGVTAWSGQRIIHILNQGSVNIEVLTDDEATYGQIVFPGDVYQDVVDGVIYVMSASAGSARVTEKRYASS